MSKIKIIIPGKPIPKARPRFSKWGTYDIQSKLKKEIRLEIEKQILAQRHLSPFSGDISCKMYFGMPIPKSWSKKRRMEAEKGMPHNVKPDCSNIFKFYEDIMNGIVYADDSQITYLECRKAYDVEPKTIIEIEEKSFVK